MDFIGREEELRFLEEKYSSKKGELVILYGRRRVGKTETLRRFCRGKKHIFNSCAETSDRDQLAAFGTRMLAEHPAASRYLTRFENWETAFRSIAELPGAEKKLLVIDEFPYMVRGNRSIPSVLQNLWDAELKDRNVMIVLCGSAMSFIEKEILAEKNPLYGRATGILKMLPMDFYDAARFFPKKSSADLIALYSILGGVPYYLSQFDPSASVETNVCDHILRRGAVLYNEKLELGAYVAFDTKNLPRLFQWKNMKSHDYVVGLEPCNYYGINREAAADAGKLAVLSAYSSVENHLEFGVLDGITEIRSFIKNL